MSDPDPPGGTEPPEPPAPPEPPEPDEPPGPDDASPWERWFDGAMSFLNRRISGDYEVDEFGFDPDLTEHVLLPPLRAMYRRWFRVETLDVERVPAEGAALLVANHSGTLPMDALMLSVALRDDHPAARHVRMLAADLVFTAPLIGPLARKAGHTLACTDDTRRLLDHGELVGVFPEGFKGSGKPFSERYKLQRFGRGGFVTAALRSGVPIVPVAIVGAEEIYPMIGNLRPLARALGLPYFPVTPTFPWLGPLGAIPLPSKWLIGFGTPVETASYGPEAAEDPMFVFELTDRIREIIQGMVHDLLRRRGPAFGPPAGDAGPE